ncbi:MAG: hypothetical protein U0354_03600 [Candidatus Sericytochromatia bacterium]
MYYSSFYYLLSSWKEIAFVLIIIISLLFFPYKFLDFKKNVSIKFLLIIVILSIYGIIVGLGNKYNIFNVMVDNRDIMLPLYYFVLFLVMKFEVKNYKLLNYFLLFFISIHSVEAIYSYFTFSGNVKELWFYENAVSSTTGLQFDPVNFVRNDKVRATGFFSSPLEYSLTLVFFLYINLYYILADSKWLNKIFFVLNFIFISSAIYVSQVRTSFLTFFMGGLVFLFIYSNRVKLKYKSFIALFTPISYVILTFVYLSFNISDFLKDPSSLGRITQYIEAFELLTSKFGGIGFGNVGPKGEYGFDSNVLVSLMAFGWLGGIIYNFIYLYIYIKLISYISTVKLYSKDINFNVLYFSILSYYSCFIYFFAFQYTLSFALQYLIMIISAVLISRCKEIDAQYVT